MPIILAHGVIGYTDEILTVVVGLAFLLFVGYGWYKDRALDAENKKPDHPTIDHE